MREPGVLYDDGSRGHTHHSAPADICSLSVEEGNTIRLLRAIHHPPLTSISLSTFWRSEEQSEPSQHSLAFLLRAGDGALQGSATTGSRRLLFLQERARGQTNRLDSDNKD